MKIVKKKLCEIVDFSGCDNISPERQAELDAEMEALRAERPALTRVELSDDEMLAVKQRVKKIERILRGQDEDVIPEKFIFGDGMIIR